MHVRPLVRPLARPLGGSGGVNTSGSGGGTSAVIAPPDAFTIGQWSVAATATPGVLRFTITTLPNLNGGVVSDINYSTDNGSTWLTSGTTTTGTFDVLGLTGGTPYSCKVRLVTNGGNGAGSDTKVATPASANPTISLFSGGGYSGSVYQSTAAGQWTADGVNIGGETGATYTMTVANEGTQIQCNGSNIIEMWVPTDLPGAQKTNGAWINPRLASSVTLVSSEISNITDLFGVRDHSQATAALRPAYTANAIVQPNAGNDPGTYLAPSGSYSPGYFALVIQYMTGTETTFTEYLGFLSYGSGGSQSILVLAGGNDLYSAGPCPTASINVAAQSAVILPLPKSMIEFAAAFDTAAWGLGEGNANYRSWRGTTYEFVACGTAPTGATQAKLQGYLAWANGIQAGLPGGHTYKSAPPYIIAP